MAREFDSEIWITPEDKWIFRGDEITQEDILLYFRKNLKQDERGVYIRNQFGELEEHGYLNLDGYPLHITYVSEEGGSLFFSTDSGITLGLEDLNIRLADSGELIACETGKEKIRYRFNRQASGQLANYIQEEGEDFTLEFNGEKIPIPTIES